MQLNPKIKIMLEESDKKGIDGTSLFENDTKSFLQSLAIQHLAEKLNDHPKKNKRRHHQPRLLSA